MTNTTTIEPLTYDEAVKAYAEGVRRYRYTGAVDPEPVGELWSRVYTHLQSEKHATWGLFLPEGWDVEVERPGEGQAGGPCLRLSRTTPQPESSSTMPS